MLKVSRRIGLGEGDGTIATGDVVRIQHAVQAALKGLASPLFTTLKALPDSVLPETLYVTGDISELDGVCEFLAEALEVDVQPLSLQAAVADFEEGSQVPADQYAPALGLVLALMRRSSAMPMNFRHGEFAYQGDLRSTVAADSPHSWMCHRSFSRFGIHDDPICIGQWPRRGFE